jgi:hypothetical protein
MGVDKRGKEKRSRVDAGLNKVRGRGEEEWRGEDLIRPVCPDEEEEGSISSVDHLGGRGGGGVTKKQEITKREKKVPAERRL